MNHHKQRKMVHQEYIRCLLSDAVKMLKYRYRSGYPDCYIEYKYSKVIKEIIRALGYLQIYVDIEQIPKNKELPNHYKLTFTGLVK